MGTNFYTLDGIHIGKRSAAGAYCWDCNMTLCKDGIGGVHQGRSDWYEVCPSCHKPVKKEGFDSSSAGRELGFNKNPFSAKKGVQSCSSFGWAIDPDQFWASKRRKLIRDEYGRRYTLGQFKEVMKECPIQKTDSIGQEFS